MIVITTDAHAAHDPATMAPSPSGRPFYDRAERVGQLLSAVRRLGLPTAPAPNHGMAAIAAVHDAGYLEFLETAFERWQATQFDGQAVRAFGYAVRAMQRRPDAITGQAGYYLSGETVPVLQGTWQAAKASAHVAIEGAQRILDGAGEAYALCRPSGHHVYADLAGGFCYLNNAAIAAHVLAGGGAKPAVLDVDVHHGNGTQGILYDRDDVFFCSVHGDPRGLYPWYAGYEDESGTGRGAGCNLNLPLPAATGDAAFVEAVEKGLSAIRKFGASALVISLGFDAHAGDPTANLAVTSDGFRTIGERIGAFGVPTVLVQEGGYLIDKLADNLSAFLSGFLAARRA
ncbi:MAG TPA: histone deacetylase family protein [Acetobacteraceae bacterium]|nr:histone deacetylase family protein [Acetobacteraceae bacterium]